MIIYAETIPRLIGIACSATGIVKGRDLSSDTC
jgi:hypothetical protein